MNILDKINSNFKVELVCDKNTKIVGEIYRYKNGILSLQIDEIKFKPEKYKEIILNLKGDGYNFITEPVTLIRSKKLSYLYDISDLKINNNNKRMSKRVNIVEKCVLEQLGLEYGVYLHNISLSGAKTTLKKKITILGVFNLKFTLLYEHRFIIPTTIVNAYVDEDNENIHLHLKFVELLGEDETRLAKCINDIQLSEIRKVRDKVVD